MKRLSAFLILSTLVSACSPAGPEDGTLHGDTELEAAISAPRTSLDGLKIVWDEGDGIVVNGKRSTGISIYSDGRLARFTLPFVSAPYCAFYPSRQFVTGSWAPASGQYGTLMLPQTQSYVPESFDPDAALMGAYTDEGGRLNFSCATAFLKITVESSLDVHPVKSIEIRPIGDECIFGKMSFDQETGGFTISGNGYGMPVIVDCGDGVPHGTVIYAAIATGCYASGLSITINDTEGHCGEVRSTKAFAAEAGTVYRTTVPFSPDGTVVDWELPEAEELSVSWDHPKNICSGGYGRAHRLNDGRLMLSYTNNYNAYCRFSSDDGASWSNAVKVAEGFSTSRNGNSAFVSCATPDFAQLSKSHPTHPGRIIYAINHRPKASKGSSTVKSSVYPYSIAVSYSDDGGQNWSEQKAVYMSKRWSDNAKKGAWEPFVLELPDGTVQVYFTDNTPYGANNQDGLPFVNSKGNNISVIESKDGGESWGKERIVCHTDGGWDGMPVAFVRDGRIWLSVEHKDVTGSSYPMRVQLMSCTLDDDWKTTVQKNSSSRFYPFSQNSAYRGAPYIISTGHYFAVSYQSSEGRASSLSSDNPYPEVRVCLTVEKTEDGKFTDARATSWPYPDSRNGSTGGFWNSLCDLGGDAIGCVTQYGGQIYFISGQIRGE